MTARRRFYTSVSVTEDFGIALDGRVVKTPFKSRLILPTRALAEAVAAEWEGQGEKINPATMLFDNLPGQGEAETDPPGFGRKIWFKDLFPMQGVVDTAAGIRDGQYNFSPALCTMNPQFTPMGHGIEGIKYQIEKAGSQ